MLLIRFPVPCRRFPLPRIRLLLRHPGARRDPRMRWGRRIARNRRFATMGPGVRRDDEGGQMGHGRFAPSPSFPRRRESRHAAVALSAGSPEVMDSRLRGNDEGGRRGRYRLNHVFHPFPPSSSRRMPGSTDALGSQDRTKPAFRNHGSRRSPGRRRGPGMTEGPGSDVSRRAAEVPSDGGPGVTKLRERPAERQRLASPSRPVYRRD